MGEKEKGVYELSVESEPNADVRRPLFALLARKGWPMLALKNTDLTLEDLFLQLTSSDTAYSQNEDKVDIAYEPESAPDGNAADGNAETEKGGEEE